MKCAAVWSAHFPGLWYKSKIAGGKAIFTFLPGFGIGPRWRAGLKSVTFILSLVSRKSAYI